MYFLTKIVFKAVKFFLPKLKFVQPCFSQEGEDMVLDRIFAGKVNGFYIDIGAHHPFRYSNTYKFYLKGWRGMNIDAMPGSMKIFNAKRKRDINLEMAIYNKKENLKFYQFNDRALNTFSETEAKKKDGINNYKVVKTELIETFTLTEVLDKFLPRGIDIDFISIDAEGVDIQILQSNNWSKYRPSIILVEDLNSDVESSMVGDLYKLLKSQNYRLIARTFNTAFYKDSLQ